jgi:hypothetical protein
MLNLKGLTYIRVKLFISSNIFDRMFGSFLSLDLIYCLSVCLSLHFASVDLFFLSQFILSFRIRKYFLENNKLHLHFIIYASNHILRCRFSGIIYHFILCFSHFLTNCYSVISAVSKKSFGSFMFLLKIVYIFMLRLNVMNSSCVLNRFNFIFIA